MQQAALRRHHKGSREGIWKAFGSTWKHLGGIWKQEAFGKHLEAAGSIWPKEPEPLPTWKQKLFCYRWF